MNTDDLIYLRGNYPGGLRCFVVFDDEASARDWAAQLSIKIVEIGRVGDHPYFGKGTA